MVMPLWDHSPLRQARLPVVTWALIAANVLVFIFEAATPDSNALLANLGAIPANITDGVKLAGHVPTYATLVTYMFLHANIFHLLGNMIFLWVFGDDIEEALGPWRFIVFYVACGVLAALVFIISAPHANGPLIGASGAIAGVLAGYLMFRPCQKVAVFLPWFFLWLFVRPVVKIDAYWVLGAWLLMQIWSISVQTNDQVAYMAHVGGFAAGAALFPLMRYRTVKLFSCVENAPETSAPTGT